MATTMLEFADLLAQAQQGDKAAQGEMLDRLQGFLRGLSLREMDARLGVRLNASDIVQQTYMTALKGFDKFEGSHPGEFLAWLRKVHRHVVLNQARRHLAEKRSIEREDHLSNSHLVQVSVTLDSTPSGKVMKGEAVMRLIRSLDTLPDDQREAVRLRYCESWPLKQIATEMQRSEPAVAGLLKRGLQGLRARLSNEVL